MNILFLCTGNKFRSKLCEVIATELDKSNNYNSCGIGAKTYGFITPLNLRKRAKRLGYKDKEKLFYKRSIPINDELVEWSDMIIYMQKNHLKQLLSKYPKSKKKFIFLGKFYHKEITRIPDLAFISKKNEYFRAMFLIILLVKRLLKEI